MQESGLFNYMSLKGYKLTEDHKKKLSLAHKGKKPSEEHRKKISEVMKGKMPKFIPNNKGVKRTPENKKKISDTLKRKGIIPPSRKGIFKENALIRQKGYKAFLEKRREIKKKNNGGSHTFGDWQTLKAKLPS